MKDAMLIRPVLLMSKASMAASIVGRQPKKNLAKSRRRPVSDGKQSGRINSGESRLKLTFRLPPIPDRRSAAMLQGACFLEAAALRLGVVSLAGRLELELESGPRLSTGVESAAELILLL